MYVQVLVEQDRDGRVERGWATGDVGEVAVVGPVEEAGEGLGKLLAVGGVGDEVPPGRGDALEAVEGLGGEAGEDLHDEVVGEEGGRRIRRRVVACPQLLLLGTLRLVHGARSG